MKFQLVFSEESLAQLTALDNNTAKRIMDRLDRTASNPPHFFERLAGREESKLRIGDYRVVVRVLAGEKKIFVMSLGHRKNIYKKLK